MTARRTKGLRVRISTLSVSSLALAALLWVAPASATVYYFARTDGSSTCNGMTDRAWSAAVAPYCAFEGMGVAVAGTILDGYSVTINATAGTTFGSKSPAAPVWWDNMTPKSLGSVYADAVPSGFGQCATYSYCCGVDSVTGAALDPGTYHNMAYRSVGFRSISGPHAKSKGFLAGNHYRAGPDYDPAHPCAATTTGNNVMVSKAVPITNPRTTPLYIYFWQRIDPAWEWCATGPIPPHGWGGSSCPSPGDNYKDLWIGRTGDAYGGGTGINGLNVMAGNPPNDRNSNPATIPQFSHIGWWYMYISSGSVTESSGDEGFTNAPYETVYQWKLMEVLLKPTSTYTSHSLVVWDGGERGMDFPAGTTKAPFDAGMASESTMYVMPGGYSRTGNLNNWRYLADIYIDNTPARVMLCTLATATADNHGICYPQPPTAWSPTSITFTVNQGQFASGTTAYLYVYDSTGTALDNDLGTPGTQGYPVVIGTVGGQGGAPDGGMTNVGGGGSAQRFGPI